MTCQPHYSLEPTGNNPLTGATRHSMGAVIQQCTRIAPGDVHHHEHKQPRRNIAHMSVTISSSGSSMLQTHCTRAISNTSHQAEFRQHMGRTIPLVLHCSFLCLVLFSLKPHGLGQSTTSAILPLYLTAHHSWSTPLRLVTVTSTYQEPAVKNFTT